MDVHVRCLYEDLLKGYLSYMIPALRLTPDFEVQISLLSENSLVDVVSVFRSIYSNVKANSLRRSHEVGRSN